jgi:5-methylthioadenosine/S-adenosylhomocysteine deaminase
MAPRLAIRGATLVTMDPAHAVVQRDVLVDDSGRIEEIVEPGTGAAERTLDARGRMVVPGLVQAHVHLCQTLFRGLAEERPLLAWLRERIWPLEAAHDPDSLRASARLGIGELVLGGTTAILDMGTVHHTQILFETAAEMGIRYTGGKAMMDAGDGVPDGLRESTAASLRESDRLAAAWHQRETGRLRYAYSPRFALSSTWDLMRSVGARARTNDMLVHTHASEQREETDLVRQRFAGASNIELLANLGLANTNACLAHCVWPEPHELDILASGGATVVHCPSCNLKMASGVAPIAEFLEHGVNVALGADGAAANNRLDGWEELRLAGLLSSFRSGPGAVTAVELFELATIGGAQALGIDAEVGSIEAGKYADLTILDLQRPHSVGPEDVYTQLVYSARAADVRTVLVGGQILVDEGVPTGFKEADILADAALQRTKLVQRAHLS